MVPDLRGCPGVAGVGGGHDRAAVAHGDTVIYVEKRHGPQGPVVGDFALRPGGPFVGGDQQQALLAEDVGD